MDGRRRILLSSRHKWAKNAVFDTMNSAVGIIYSERLLAGAAIIEAPKHSIL